MAIVFTKSIPQNKLLYAFNNNVVRFHSNSSLIPATAEIIGLGISIVLYPNPTGDFYFNFKEYISTIINTDNFKDDMNVVAGTWSYDWTSKILLQNAITIKIIFEDDTFETSLLNLNWLSSYMQVDEFKDTYFGGYLIEEFVLTPQINGIIPNLKYWYGYPFDFTMYTPNVGTNVDVKNISINGLFTINNPHPKIQRVVLSNGISELGLFNTYAGQNQFKLEDNVTDYYFNIEKIIPNCDNKHYLKWINRYGGWNYWLFDRGKKTITPKGIGEVNNDFNNVEDTLSQTINMGVTSRKSIAMNDDINDDDMMLLGDLFESPKVYLFTGKPNTFCGFKDWIEVNVKDKAIKIQDSKYNYINVQLEVELPARTTRTI